MLPPRQRDQLFQVLAEGHARLSVEPAWDKTPALLELIEHSLGAMHMRTVRVAPISLGELKARDFLLQVSSATARSTEDPLSDDDLVAAAFHDLVRRNAGSEQTVLLIDGSRGVQAAVWSTVQMACRTAPHLRVAFAGPEAHAPIMQAAGADGLGDRPVTTLRLSGMTDDVEASLVAALQGRSSIDDAVRRIQSSFGQAHDPSPRPPPFDPSRYATDPEPEPARRGVRRAVVLASVVAAGLLSGAAYWRLGPPGLSPTAQPAEVAQAAPPTIASTVAATIVLAQADPVAAPATPFPTAPTAGERRIASDEPIAPPAAAPVEAVADRSPALPVVVAVAELVPAAPIVTVAEERPVAPSKPMAASVNADSLVQRGEALLKSGDVSGARLLYEVAADAGFARGAMALAGTYDSSIIIGLRAPGLRPDATRAVAWYRRALDLGDQSAFARLQTLHAPQTTVSRLTDRQP